MSGTEAVMQAVRLARYHTKRSHLVRFCGAYHGWWGDVQPGIGNPSPADDTYTLAEMSENTLRVLRRRRDIACVLVNPLQALHPNAAAPAEFVIGRQQAARRDSTGCLYRMAKKVAPGMRRAQIVLIFDEVFVGFRLARGGAKEYFGVQPDLITYGKSLGGGLPVGYLWPGRSDEAISCQIVPWTSASPGGHSTRIPMSWARCASSCTGSTPDMRDMYRDLDRSGTLAPIAQPRLSGGSSGQSRQSLIDLDGVLHAAVALQLDAAILSSRRRAGTELGGNRAADLQPELHGQRFRCGRRSFRLGMRAMGGTAGGRHTIAAATDRSGAVSCGKC